MPFAPLILRKIAEVQGMGIPLDMIAPSHGIIWRSEPTKIVNAYVKWSQGHAEDKVLVIYDTMWESTEVMAKAIMQGIMGEGVKTRLFHLRKSDWTEILKEVLEAKAILIGSPTLNNGMFHSVGGFLTYLKGLRPQKKVAAVFGSYGWGKGAVKAINEELKRMGLDALEPGLEVQYLPSEDDVKSCVEFGANIARRVKETKRGL